MGCGMFFFLVGVWRGIEVFDGLDVVGTGRNGERQYVSAYPGSTRLNRKHRDENKKKEKKV